MGVENGYNFPTLNVSVTVVLNLFVWCGGNMLFWHSCLLYPVECSLNVVLRHFFSGQKFKILWFVNVVAFDEFVLLGIFCYSLDACGNVCCMFYNEFWTSFILTGKSVSVIYWSTSAMLWIKNKMISENAGLQFYLVECVSGTQYILVKDSAKHHFYLSSNMAHILGLW